MKAIERTIQVVGRFAVGFGIGLALVSTFVIVTTVPTIDPVPFAKPVEVIRLDPVSVTISADRFHEIQAKMIVDSMLAQTRGESPLADG